MVTTLQECELYAAVSTYLTTNGYVADYRMLAEFPAVGHSSIEGLIEWRTAPAVSPTTQNLIDSYNNYLAAQLTAAQAIVTEQSAQQAAANIPQWASWTEEQALDWHQTNISALIPVPSLAAANTVLQRMDTELKALIRMNIALRNKTFPTLQG